MDLFLHDKWMLVHDAGDLVYYICHNWLSLATGSLGALLVTILWYYRDDWLKHTPKSIEDKGWKFGALLIAFLLPATFSAWHDLENNLRNATQERNTLKEQLADAQKPPATPPTVVDIGNKETTGTRSPIVSGSGNSFTYGSPPPDKPTPKPSGKKP
jgi:hypothetical protein